MRIEPDINNPFLVTINESEAEPFPGVTRVHIEGPGIPYGQSDFGIFYGPTEQITQFANRLWDHFGLVFATGSEWGHGRAWELLKQFPPPSLLQSIKDRRAA